MENEILKKARNPRVSIMAKSSVSIDQWKKYMEPQENVKVELSVQELLVRIGELIKQVNSLGVIIGTTLGLVDWLQNWAPFSFDDMTEDEIKTAQSNIIIWVRGQLSEIDTSTGVVHSVNFSWVELSTSPSSTLYRLRAYLNPSAVVLAGVPGSGTVVVSPMQPPQPPPPTF